MIDLADAHPYSILYIKTKVTEPQFISVTNVAINNGSNLIFKLCQTDTGDG